MQKHVTVVFDFSLCCISKTFNLPLRDKGKTPTSESQSLLKLLELYQYCYAHFVSEL